MYRIAGYVARRVVGKTAGQIALAVASRAVLAVVREAVRTAVLQIARGASDERICVHLRNLGIALFAQTRPFLSVGVTGWSSVPGFSLGNLCNRCNLRVGSPALAALAFLALLVVVEMKDRSVGLRAALRIVCGICGWRTRTSALHPLVFREWLCRISHEQ